jgi:hypothetical protein
MEANIPAAWIKQMYNQCVSRGIEQEYTHLNFVLPVVLPKGEAKGEGDWNPVHQRAQTVSTSPCGSHSSSGSCE